MDRETIYQSWRQRRFISIGKDGHITERHIEIDKAINEALALFAEAPTPYAGGAWIHDLRAYCKATAKRFNALADLMRPTGHS